MPVDLLLRPHCDLHMALAGTPPLTLRVLRRQDSATPGVYTLTPVPVAECVYEFMAPHNDPGHRFDNLPTVDAAGVVTAAHPGVYLFQIRRNTEYIVGRLQVHDQLVSWWFGNDSITTAVDGTIAHAQPSIYARFSDDQVGGVPIGTDLVGDITGHGYVQLASADTAKVVVTADGRLRGVAETAPTATVNVTGTFTGQPPQTLPVRVVDYAKHRRDLVPIQAPNMDRIPDAHNIVFISEGFTAADSGLFDQIVTRAVKDIFDQPRHQPYAMLEGSFNIFKAFVPSQQRRLTCGFRVTDTDAGAGRGAPIPYNSAVSENTGVYTPRELVSIVGLPKRGENRPDLKAVWGAQGLKGFEAARVDDPLISAWKAQQPVGILHAQDTFFGMLLGQRWADRTSDVSDPAVARPATDTPADAATKAFVARVYEFYSTFSTRIMTPDPRRHPPELQAGNFTNPRNAIVSYLKGLDYFYLPNTPIGAVWDPDDTRFKPSRGLVALISYDGIIGGTNLNNNTLTALTMSRSERLGFDYENPPADKHRMRRKSGEIDPDYQDITDTVAHEFGHSFNLQDEYEFSGNDDPDFASATDILGDNTTRLGVIRFGAAPARDIDPAKVKWLALPRARMSARLTAPSQLVGNTLQVTIEKRYAPKWVQARDQNPPPEVHLRNFGVGPQGQQLPLATGPGQFLTGLKVTAVDPAQGLITLTGPQLPPAGSPFAAGSALFIPLKDEQGRIVTVVERKVLDHLTATHKVLNSDPDTTKRNRDADHPVSISNFKPPCKSSKLIGVYEGAVQWAGGNYRPAGNCKMRTQADSDQGGEFCFVCKWLIVNRVDPGYLSIISGMFYPEAKKNG